MAMNLGISWEDVVCAAGMLAAIVHGERAQTLAEYSLLLTLVGVGVVVPTMLLFRSALAGAFSDATACILRTTC